MELESGCGAPVVVKTQNVYEYICANFNAANYNSGSEIDIFKECPFPIPQFPAMFFEHKVRHMSGRDDFGLFLAIEEQTKDQVTYGMVAFVEEHVIWAVTGVTFSLPECECLGKGEFYITQYLNPAVGDGFMTDTFFPVMLAMSFMNCKNVQMIKHDPPQKVTQKRLKQNKQPRTTYYTLEIEPMKKILKTKGMIDEIGLQRALHICRGHFKDYSESNGLFGKYKGRYWWNNSVKGADQAGVIKKDYSIKV